MDFVNKFRDFQKISQDDLENAFSKLRWRCPNTWKCKLQVCARNFHKKIMTLRDGDFSEFIDPSKYEAYEVNKQDNPWDLIISPNLWHMDTKEAVMNIRQVIHHFTIYAPFEGRPFIRAWLEALVPCFCRWILLSDSAEDKENITLKNMLGAFGQPGIVVCLADKGKKLLQTLQDSARSVEALGRGTVERYYWKRLAESSYGGNKDWSTLSNIPNKDLVLSQLNTLPKDFLLDSTDIVHAFANILSPKISSIFEKRVNETIRLSKVEGDVHPGPAKTLARSIAKCHEYQSDYRSDKTSSRWINFCNTFQDVYGRSPENHTDFVWNIVDFARCSVIVRGAGDLLKVKKVIEDQFKVVCIKNGYNREAHVKGSGYRDMKILVE